MVKGIPIFKEKNPSCESFILGKHKRTSFPQSSTQAKQHLDMFHTDLCGPMKTKSIGGSIFFLSLLITLAGKYGSIFSDSSLKILQSSKNSRLKLTNRVGNT
jgi:hypothetical protein